MMSFYAYFMNLAYVKISSCYKYEAIKKPLDHMWVLVQLQYKAAIGIPK